MDIKKYIHTGFDDLENVTNVWTRWMNNICGNKYV